MNSIDADGTKEGYEMTLTRMISTTVGIPVIASGGAGHPDTFCGPCFRKPGPTRPLIASITHYGEYTIGQLKDYLRQGHVKVRETW